MYLSVVVLTEVFFNCSTRVQLRHANNGGMQIYLNSCTRASFLSLRAICSLLGQRMGQHLLAPARLLGKKLTVVVYVCTTT